MTKIYTLLAALLLCFSISSYGQRPNMPTNGGPRQSGSPRNGANESNPGHDHEHSNTPDTVKPASAWTLTFPLGDHVKAELDTSTYNFQRRYIPTMVSDAYATTGNLGSEGINMIYFNRPQRSDFIFDDTMEAWLPTFSKQKFYNVYVPTTILSYGWGGNKMNHQDLLQMDFAGNVNRRVGIGAKLDYLYSKGCYEAQAAKNFCYGLSTYYLGDRYELQLFYNHYNSLNKENGGITDDLYITDPAQLQGGVSTIEPKSIPTRLNKAHNRVNGDELFMTHAYKIGFWMTEHVNDTLDREIYVPVTRFIYSFDMRHRHHTFLNSNATQAAEFWGNFYLDPNSSHEETYLTEITNSAGMELIEGFQKWAKFGLSAFITQQSQKYRMPTDFRQPELSDADWEKLTPLPDGVRVASRHSRNLLWVGGRLQKDKGTLLRYAADARFGLVGDVVGDLELNGKLSTRFKLLGDTVMISGFANFKNLAQPYLLQRYISNHFAWSNDFGKTRRYRVGGELLIPWTRTTISAGVENIQNLVYFNSNSLPDQYGGNVQVFSARAEQLFTVGILNWNNTITYQKTSQQSVLPLPELAVYSNLFIKFTAFNVLHINLGVDCDYYTRYTSLNYQPATMQFHVQGEDAVKVGNYPFCNAYLSAKLHQTRFYIMMTHVNQGMSPKDSFILPHYPMNPRRLEMGLSIDFSN